MSDLSNITIQYAFSPDSSEDHQKVCQDAISFLLHYAMDSNLAIVDCHIEGEENAVPIIAAMLDNNGQSAVLPLARIFMPDEDVSNTYEPCLLKPDEDGEQ